MLLFVPITTISYQMLSEKSSKDAAEEMQKSMVARPIFWFDSIWVWDFHNTNRSTTDLILFSQRKITVTTTPNDLVVLWLKICHYPYHDVVFVFFLAAGNGYSFGRQNAYSMAPGRSCKSLFRRLFSWGKLWQSRFIFCFNFLIACFNWLLAWAKVLIQLETNAVM